MGDDNRLCARARHGPPAPIDWAFPYYGWLRPVVALVVVVPSFRHVVITRQQCWTVLVFKGTRKEEPFLLLLLLLWFRPKQHLRRFPSSRGIRGIIIIIRMMVVLCMGDPVSWGRRKMLFGRTQGVRSRRWLRKEQRVLMQAM